jgi:hypothetical protein
MDFTVFLEPTIITIPHFAVSNSNLYDKRYQIERLRVQLKRRSISEKRHTTLNRLNNEIKEDKAGLQESNPSSDQNQKYFTTASKKVYRSTTCKQKYQTRR